MAKGGRKGGQGQRGKDVLHRWLLRWRNGHEPRNVGASSSRKRPGNGFVPGASRRSQPDTHVACLTYRTIKSSLYAVLATVFVEIYYGGSRTTAVGVCGVTGVTPELGGVWGRFLLPQEEDQPKGSLGKPEHQRCASGIRGQTGLLEKANSDPSSKNTIRLPQVSSSCL